MLRKSPYLDRFPVLSLQTERLSRYMLRRSKRDDHFCTAEVAALCLALAGEAHAMQTLEAYLDVFTNHYLQAKLSCRWFGEMRCLRSCTCFAPRLEVQLKLLCI